MISFLNLKNTNLNEELMNSFKIFLFLISLFIFSCGESQDITKQLNINAESYQIPTGHTTGAKPQLFINYFVPSEKRPIMVHGYYPENDAPSFISATGVNVEYSTLGNGTILIHSIQ